MKFTAITIISCVILGPIIGFLVLFFPYSAKMLSVEGALMFVVFAYGIGIIPALLGSLIFSISGLLYARLFKNGSFRMPHGIILGGISGFASICIISSFLRSPELIKELGNACWASGAVVGAILSIFLSPMKSPNRVLQNG